jgi:hypothetical protein
VRPADGALVDAAGRVHPRRFAIGPHTTVRVAMASDPISTKSSPRSVTAVPVRTSTPSSHWPPPRPSRSEPCFSRAETRARPRDPRTSGRGGQTLRLPRRAGARPPRARPHSQAGRLFSTASARRRGPRHSGGGSRGTDRPRTTRARGGGSAPGGEAGAIMGRGRSRQGEPARCRGIVSP